MKKISDDELSAMLKASGREVTSEPFTQRLLEAVVTSYKKEVTPAYTAEKWLGKCIIGMLLFFNLIFLSYLFSVSIYEVILIPLCTFVIAFYLVMLYMKKVEISSYAKKTFTAENIS